MAKAEIEPKVLKGFRDLLPEQGITRQKMLHTIEQIFTTFGFVPIDTPALEYSEILLGKGSTETDKQLFRFKDQGERDVALRFDLTVPLARYVAMHIDKLGTPFKRYHIAPVWRAEKPQRGRFREFIQCDFDIIGTNSVIADAEIISIAHETLSATGIKHRIHLNNRSILNGLLEHLAAEKQTVPILRAIDKLDKLGRDTVATELQEVASLSKAQIESVFSFLDLSKDETACGAVLEKLKSFPSSGETFVAGIKQLEDLSETLSAFGIGDESLSIDLSIARGLDYYTGTVFETSLTDLPDIGSISSGGRYDNLVSVYSKRNLSGVGASIGLDRIMAALEELNRLEGKTSTANVLVTLLDEQSVLKSVSLARTLRQAGIATELYPELAKLGHQLKYAAKKGINFAVIAGSRELDKQCVSIKNLKTETQTDDISLSEIVSFLKTHRQ